MVTEEPEFSPDANQRNADWTKRTWDIFMDGRFIDNVKDLRAYIKRSGGTVEEFKKLPVYQMNVGKLDWLKEL